jgi:hypothetical protein
VTSRTFDMRWLPRAKLLEEIQNIDTAVGSSDKTYQSSGTDLTVTWADPVKVDAAAAFTQGNAMSITGALPLGAQIREALAAVKEKLAATTDEMSAAMADLHETADHATRMVRDVKKETADLKAALGLTSNNPPAS